MRNSRKFYINGEWVAPIGSEVLDVINPATERVTDTIALGSAADVDRAVAAAKVAFGSFSLTTRKDRVRLLESIAAEYQRRSDDLASAITQEMGAPVSLAKGGQVPFGLGHFAVAIDVLKSFAFEEKVGTTTTLVKEPVGVCGLVTPWNWPLNQIAAKVAPALAAGCTMVLKPSEVAPLSALVVAEILDAAGVPAGVFNLVNGVGRVVGAAISSHPDVDMVSFTGSTRAGIEVARNAAPTVKRVTQELGGKSANIILDDADLEEVITRDVNGVVLNSGQSCNASSRILVSESRLDEAIAVAKKAAEAVVVGAPEAEDTGIGPVVSDTQFNKIQGLIKQAIDDGATVVAGGLGRPENLTVGYYVKPTVLANVTNDMTIAREEIFGPVITLIAYKDDEDAVRIANDSVYGLGGMVSSADHNRARAIARRIRTGMVHVNGAPITVDAPFGGYKQSGNGREFSKFGLEEYLETKTIYGDRDD